MFLGNKNSHMLSVGGKGRAAKTAKEGVIISRDSGAGPEIPGETAGASTGGPRM